MAYARVRGGAGKGGRFWTYAKCQLAAPERGAKAVPAPERDAVRAEKVVGTIEEDSTGTVASERAGAVATEEAGKVDTYTDTM
jgi:hypothetical protein